MRKIKNLFMFLSMVLCFSLFIGTVSHAEMITKYNETYFGNVISKMTSAEGYAASINSSGNLVIDVYGYTSTDVSNAGPGQRNARVQFDAKGKKKVNSMVDNNYKPWDKKVYGNRAYGISNASYGKNNQKLVVMSKNGKIIKSIKLNVTKFLKKKKDDVYINFAEIKKNKVRLIYSHTNGYLTGYGGVIDVNIKTGKIKKIVSTNDFMPIGYEGKNVYGYSFKPRGYGSIPKKVLFYMKSLKTGKTKKFTAPAIPNNPKMYMKPIYAFYNGKIMGVGPDGKVFYGTFNSKKFVQVGDISGCKYFESCHFGDMVMKNKNEFYIVYDSGFSKDGDTEEESCRKLIVVKYKNK